MNKPIKVAIFDFDDTLFQGQSHSHFFRFLKRTPVSLHKKIKYYLRCYVCNVSDNDREKKEMALNLIEGMSFEQVTNIADSFYSKVIKQRLNYNIVEFAQFLKSKNYILVLASGGFGIYLENFVSEYKFDIAVTSNVLFDNNVFCGKIDGDECLGEVKSNLVTQALNEYSVDWSKSVAISDHISDIPIFNLVANKLVVDFGQDITWISSAYNVIKVNEFNSKHYHSLGLD
ncbi:HAD-IB family hydrolase [Schleiferiaceae bacterium]|nr:HAD-IB family hydrolase [Schleiferiaceae bacterium]